MVQLLKCSKNGSTSARRTLKWAHPRDAFQNAPKMTTYIYKIYIDTK